MARHSVTLFLCITGCMLSFGAFAAVHKWVDEQGVTHYGDKPPPGQKAKEVQVPTTPSSAAPAVKAKPATGWEDQSREFQQRRAERLEQERKQEEQARLESRKKCSAAQYRLDTFVRSGRVYRLDEKGERQYYDDQTRDAIVAQAKKDVAAHCRG